MPVANHSGQPAIPALAVTFRARPDVRYRDRTESI
jgi:hypothetical protein